MKIKEIKYYSLLILEIKNSHEDDVQEVFFLINRQGTKLNSNELLLSKIRIFNLDCSKEIDSLVKENETSLYWKIDSHQITRIISWYSFSLDPLDVLEQLRNDKITRENFDKDKKYLSIFNRDNWNDFIKIIKSLVLLKKDKGGYPYIFAYTLYLKLKEAFSNFKSIQIEKILAKWIILSYITERYSGNKSKDIFKKDLDLFTKNVSNINEFISKMTNEINKTFDRYFFNKLPGKLKIATTNSPYFDVYKAALISNEIKFFYSKQIMDFDHIKRKIDKISLHKLFSQKYLSTEEFEKETISCIANTVITNTQINRLIKNDDPKSIHGQFMNNWKKELRKLGHKDVSFFQRQLKFHALKENWYKDEIHSKSKKSFVNSILHNRSVNIEK